MNPATRAPRLAMALATAGLLTVPVGLHLAVLAHPESTLAVAGVWLTTTAAVILNLALLWLFARTLAPGREPLVTRIARIVRGHLDAPLERYTRRVTWAWCGFFAAMATTTVTLALCAPLATWSLFSNVLGYPLLALMFGLEYAWRRWRFRGYPHVPPHTMLARLAKAGYFRAACIAK